MTHAAIIVAAGRGTRAGGARPKQWQPVAGQRMTDRTVAAFTALEHIARIVLVLHPDDMELYTGSGRVTTVAGGATRAQSVRNGLEALADSDVDRVLIHDVARACVTPAMITGILDATVRRGARAAAPALPVTDALWQGEDGRVTGTRDRTGLYRAQTPQVFDFAAILAAHRAHDGQAADDVAVARATGLQVEILPGDETNLKITTAADFARAEKIIRGRMDIRTGTGFDVHRFGPGDRITLCGVDIPHDRALQGHSDADVGMHALSDAIYGALGMGDIGHHFPPSDPQWKGAASDIFLSHAAGLVHDAGFAIANMDVTLICERPRVGPHAGAMRVALARIAGVDAGRVSVKATTTEGLGFAGRGEGIAAQAVVTLVTS